MELFELYGDSYPAKADLPAKRAKHAGEKPVSRTPRTVRQKPAGLLQQPLQYFNPGIGAAINWEYNQRRLVVPHPAYTAVKAEYDPYPVAVEDPNLSGSRSGWTLFLDLGQVRFGHRFSGRETFTLLRDIYSPDSWEPKEPIREVQANLDKQNYGWLGLALLSFGEKEDTLYCTVWLNYGLDRLRFDLQDLKATYHYDNNTGGYASQIASQTKVGSGRGWGHSVTMDFTLATSYGQAGGNGELNLFLSLSGGFNAGHLSDDSGSWQSNFSGWLAGITLGAQFNFGAEQQKVEECFTDYGMHSGQFCDLK